MSVDWNDPYTIHLPSLTIADSKIVNGMVAVTESSRSGLKDAVERFGYYIKRENRYDFPLGYDYDGKWKAYLLLSGNTYGVGKQKPVGCAVFKWVTKDDCDDETYCNRWWLMWVWVHPYERGRGVLSRAWQHFKTEFGDFHVAPPLSGAMKGFLRKSQE